jgi:GcrA cell cycle regulator
MSTLPWTEEHETTVVKHWERGLSAGKIAAELSRILGTSVTRNMVMGKVDRLRKDGLLGARDETIQTIKLRCLMNNPRPPRPRKQHCPQVAKPKLVCRTVELELPKPDPLHIPMDALTKNSCTWSFGDPKDEDFNYCGLQVERRSFCAQHAALAYRHTAPQPHAQDKKSHPKVTFFSW